MPDLYKICFMKISLFHIGYILVLQSIDNFSPFLPIGINKSYWYQIGIRNALCRSAYFILITHWFYIALNIFIYFPTNRIILMPDLYKICLFHIGYTCDLHSIDYLFQLPSNLDQQIILIPDLY